MNIKARVVRQLSAVPKDAKTNTMKEDNVPLPTQARVVRQLTAVPKEFRKVA